MATVTIFGGTGFLGSAIARRVSAEGFDLRLATRHVPRQDPGDAGAGTSHVTADVTDEPSVKRAVAGAVAVVNAVSLYVEKAGATFEAVHVDGAAHVARCAREAGAEVVVHISGLGTDPASPSAFVRARARGEQVVREAFEAAVVARPSVMFGPNDSFLTSIEQAARLPVVPLFGRGETRLQPAYVEDVAAAVAKVIADPDVRPRELELGGADILTYRQVLEIVMAYLGRRRLLVPVPFAAWKAMTAVLSVLPSPPLTRDQVVLMERDNVATEGAVTFSDLGVRAAGLTSMLPECLPRRS